MTNEELAIGLAAKNLRAAMEGPSHKLAKYVDDPVGFAVDVLGLKMWSGMERMLNAIVESDRVLIRAGHKVSKSCSCSVVAFWWVGTRPISRVLITAPTFRQVKSIIWREMRLLYPRIKPIFGVDIPKDPITGLELPSGALIEGLSADKPENLAGVSSPELMMIVDEGSGFPDELMEVILGNAAGDAKIISPSNPTRTTGWHFDEMKNPNSTWTKLHIPSTESPNVTEDARIIPGLATRAWVEELERKCGGTEKDEKGVRACDKHPVFMVRVKGDYPDQATNSVISYQSLENAKENWGNTKPPSLRIPLTIGIDVARFGDDESVLCARRGDYLYPLKIYGGLDGWELAEKAIEYADELARTALVRFNVDGIGVGASCVDSLNRMKRKPGMVVNDITVSKKSTDGDHSNLRSQVWFGISDFLKEGGMLPPDVSLETELLSPVYDLDSQGRKRVESKKDIRKRLGRSPDRADAVGLAVFVDGWDMDFEAGFRE